MRRLAVLAAVLALAGCGDDDDDGAPAAEGDVPASSVPDEAPAAADPQIGDHWHLAIGFSECGEELPVLSDAVPDETGIHSHGDGLIHIHPFTTDVSGDGAVLGRFFETVGAEITDDAIETPEWSLPFEGECDGEPASLVLATWPSNDPGAASTVQTIVESADQLHDVPLAPDGGVIAIGLAVDGADIPRPPSEAQLDAPSDIASATTLPPATGQGTRPTDDFGIAPVLGVDGPPCGDTATPGAEDSECYELGPVAFGREGVGSAEAVDVSGWVVQLVLTSAGDDAFDGAATACYERTPACPTGLLAIVVDGDVLSAPSVLSPTFDGELQISGNFTEAEAKELAEALSP